ncbi:MAG: peptidase [Actinomycetes bacterium]
MSHTTLRRRLLAGASLLVAPLLVLSTPHVATAAETRNRADAGAGWLGRQLDDQSHVISGQFGPVYGQTADVVLALGAAGVGRGAARKATAALQEHVVDYTGGGDAAEYYAGSFAKLLVVAAARGTDARAFGTSARADLVAELRALECRASTTGCDASETGRFSDISQFGDFSNVITQALALLGLERTTQRGPSRAAVTYLLDQQCTNGAFPEALGTATCTGSVDATGYAVQALVAVGSRAALAAAGDAGRWLARRQHGNGSLSGNAVRNANSTALAAQAFDALDRGKRAREARSFMRRLQSILLD